MPLLVLILLATASARGSSTGPSGVTLGERAGGTASGQVAMEPCRPANAGRDMLCGTIAVPENWAAPDGRQLTLKLIVVPAKAVKPAAEPLFFFVGGPGQTVTEFAGSFASNWLSDDHNVVLLDERGTSGKDRLDCPGEGSDDDLEGYLRSPFEPGRTLRCRDLLQARWDLSQYTTEAQARDVEAARKALGYDNILIAGASGGTYSELMYLRRYGRHVKAALLNGVVLPESKVPLYHAAAAQEAFDEIAAECSRDASCHKAYPDVRGDLDTLLKRLDREPATVDVHSSTGKTVPAHLTRSTFADAVRVMMYSGGRELPYLLAKAKSGDLAPFAETAIQSNRGLYGSVRIGLNLAISCNEFIAGVTRAEAVRATKNSFLGSTRIDNQMAACSKWPRTDLSPGFFSHFRSNVPSLIVSGVDDPVVRPYWAERAKAYLPNSRHLLVPGGHVPDNACIHQVAEQLFRTANASTLDLTCAKDVKLARFRLPSAPEGKPL